MFKWIKNLWNRFWKKEPTHVETLEKLIEGINSEDHNKNYFTEAYRTALILEDRKKAVEEAQLTLKEKELGIIATDGKSHSDAGSPDSTQLRVGSGLMPLIGPNFGKHISPDDAAFLRSFNKPKKPKPKKKAKKSPKKKPKKTKK